MTDFITAVAECAQVDREQVIETLTEHRVEQWTPPPSPARLTVLRVGFSGHRDGAPYGPFSWEVEQGVWAIGSEGNSVGKTTVLNVIRWLLSGRERVDDAARHMIDVAELEVRIGSETCTVHVEGTPAELHGTVTVGEAESVAFSQDTFEAVMSRIMLSRLGLERVVGWQRYPKSDDGHEVGYDWASLLPGLFVPEAAYTVLLGDHAPSARRLLQMFVGMPWYPTHEAARAALSSLAQDDRDADRRDQRDAQARSQREQALNLELTQARQAAGPSPIEASAAFGKAASALEMVRVAATAASERSRAAEAELHDAAAADVAARRRVHDLSESGVAAELFGTLKPSRCPRCETALGAERVAQEAEHVCSVCDRPQAETGGDQEARLEESEQQAAEVAVELEAATAAATDARAAAAQAADAVTEAASTYNAALKLVEASEEHAKSNLSIARIEGQLAELTASTVGSAAITDLDPVRRVLECARDEALTRMDARTLLERLSKEILTVARRLGLTDVTEVALDRNGRLAVHKGEVRTWFSKLNLGERLRLKIATIIALLRVGHPSRHPGLIVIDSPAAEEMADPNLDLMLRELTALAEERDDLQVLIATTRTDALASALDATRIRHVPADERLW